MLIKEANYKTSVTKKENILQDNVPEFAFVGRSNVGKSSLINKLTGKKRLAKTSSTPGLTKMINYFDINNNFRFVDLPGYGYAKVGKGQLDVWAGLMGEYILYSSSLQTIFVLVDIRHDASSLDKEMLKFLIFHQIPFIVLATKADKLSKSKQNERLMNLATTLGIRKELIIITSAENGQGCEKVLDYIENKLEEEEGNVQD